ncbi:MAG TPA: hypothetical protein VGI57_01205 [Usitatibacter sp.]
MKNKKMALALGTAALFTCALAQAADKTCTRPDLANAQRSIDKVVSWSQLRKAWGDYKQCDTGDIADQFTDALLRMVVEWKNVEELASATDKDADYKAFVMAHIKSPAAKDDQPTVYARAKKECPKALDAFCTELADAAKGGSGAAANTGKAGIELQPLMQPLKVETVKPSPAIPPTTK